MTIGIIGGGISAAACGQVLRDRGFKIEVLEKSRGVGGRMATRRTEHGPFDHGAQYFTARDERFRELIRQACDRQAAQRWDGRIGELKSGRFHPSSNKERFVGTPTMNALVKMIWADQAIQTNVRVTVVEGHPGEWYAVDQDAKRHGPFRVVISTAPAEQSSVLLAPSDELRSEAEKVRTDPCWAVMLSLPKDDSIVWDGAFVNDHPISWISRNASKPQRPPQPDNYVVHASPDWSRANIQCENADVTRRLLDDFTLVTGLTTENSLYCQAHRWMYSIPATPLERPFLFDAKLQLAACGDWCGGPRVEGAYLSGRQLGEHLAEALGLNDED